MEINISIRITSDDKPDKIKSLLYAIGDAQCVVAPNPFDMTTQGEKVICEQNQSDGHINVTDDLIYAMNPLMVPRKLNHDHHKMRLLSTRQQVGLDSAGCLRVVCKHITNEDILSIGPFFKSGDRLAFAYIGKGSIGRFCSIVNKWGKVGELYTKQRATEEMNKILDSLGLSLKFNPELTSHYIATISEYKNPTNIVDSNE